MGAIVSLILYTNIDQILVNSLHGLLNCELQHVGGLDCCVITEQNISLFRHSAYIAHSPNTNTAGKRKEEEKSQ